MNPEDARNAKVRSIEILVCEKNGKQNSFHVKAQDTEDKNVPLSETVSYNKWQIMGLIFAVPYVVFLIIMLCQPTEDAVHDFIQEYVDSGATSQLDPILADCTISASNVLSHADIYLLAHFVGYFLSALVLRNYTLAWIFSIVWEPLEQLVVGSPAFHVNFEECWWDSLFFDILGMNWLGLECGMLVVRLVTRNQGLFFEFDELLCKCNWRCYQPIYERSKQWYCCCLLISCERCARPCQCPCPCRCPCRRCPYCDDEERDLEVAGVIAGSARDGGDGDGGDDGSDHDDGRGTSIYVDGPRMKWYYPVLVVLICDGILLAQQSHAFLIFMIAFWMPPGNELLRWRELTYFVFGAFAVRQTFDLFLRKDSVLNKRDNTSNGVVAHLVAYIKCTFWLWTAAFVIAVETAIVIRAYVAQY